MTFSPAVAGSAPAAADCAQGGYHWRGQGPEGPAGVAEYVLAIDQGTTSTRALLFDEGARIAAMAQETFEQHFPRPGEVEHEPEDLWTTTVSTVRTVLEKAGCRAGEIAAVGIANQRETVLVWERATGRPIHRAIVWQDRRTADACAVLRDGGHEALVSERTGLLLDPYFSATKIAWILDHVEGARARAAAGELAFGTVDTFLLWRLTGGRVHATDATNASRTSLYDLRTGDWDPELLELFRVPREVLPEIRDSAANLGTCRPELFGGGIGIAGVAGDQQAATLGQGCFAPGMMKATYGTGCFLVVNLGTVPIASRNRLLTTVVWQHAGKRVYGLEGSIFIAGAGVQWLRDELGTIASAPESGRLAAESDPDQDVYLVPAFTGLGAPWWDADARGAIFGLTRGTGRAELARSALEAVGYQTRDLIEAVRGDGVETSVLRVDGAMAGSDWTMQFLADVLDLPVDRPVDLETTARGAAWLAGFHAGFYPGPQEWADGWERDRRFTPALEAQVRERKLRGWHDAVRRTLTGSEPVSPESS